MSNNDLIEPRRDYAAQTLRRAELTQNPTEQFKLWLQQARDAQLIDATAMVLATADSAGQPHARIVLLKQVDDAGFVWFTYKDSDKGQQIAANPQASILFYWRELERQVRVEGSVTDIANTSADDYFYSRPEGSRFSAAVSLQSAPVHDRSVLEQGVAALHSQHPDDYSPTAVSGRCRSPAHRSSRLTMVLWVTGLVT